MSPEEEYEILKKDYILNTDAHLKKLNDLQLDDFTSADVLSDLAVSQQNSVTSFANLWRFIHAFHFPRP